MSTSPTYLEPASLSARFPRVSQMAGAIATSLAVLAATYVYIIFTFDVPKPVLIFPALALVAAGVVLTDRRWAAIPGILICLANIAVTAPQVFQWHIHDVENANAVIASVLLSPAATFSALTVAIAYTARAARGCDDRELGRPGQVGLLMVAGAVIGGSLIALTPNYGATSRVSTAAVESLEPSIVMGDSLFRETEMRVTAGETVQWRVMNADAIGHTFDIDDMNIHMSLKGGESGLVMFVADTPGTYEYSCFVPGHEDMKGKLIVE